jgi:hypothetical protein
VRCAAESIIGRVKLEFEDDFGFSFRDSSIWTNSTILDGEARRKS